MTEWKYLWSEAFKSRYALAAWLLQDTPHIVEVGGYKTPITDFLPLDVGFINSVTVYDPKLVVTKEWLYEGAAGNVRCRHLADPFNPKDPFLPRKDYAVVILGMELHMDEPGWEAFLNYLKGARKVVIEYPIEHVHSRDQFARITGELGFKVTFEVLMELAGNDFGDLTDSAPPKTLRRIVALEPEKEAT